MKLQDYLDKKKMSLSEFARIAGMPVANVWRYARGNKHPSFKNLRYIRQATKGKVTEKDFE